jgi:oligopeptide transport system ATP-binding protein
MSADGGGGAAAAAVVRVDGLVKHFPIGHSRAFVAAVNGVSFEIARGETLGLVGESGSGKSTVARCIMNLESSTAGKIFFEGREISGVRAKEARVLRR